MRIKIRLHRIALQYSPCQWPISHIFLSPYVSWWDAISNKSQNVFPSLPCDVLNDSQFPSGNAMTLKPCKWESFSTSHGNDGNTFCDYITSLHDTLGLRTICETGHCHEAYRITKTTTTHHHPHHPHRHHHHHHHRHKNNNSNNNDNHHHTSCCFHDAPRDLKTQTTNHKLITFIVQYTPTQHRYDQLIL